MSQIRPFIAGALAALASTAAASSPLSSTPVPVRTADRPFPTLAPALRILRGLLPLGATVTTGPDEISPHVKRVRT